jgi:hypothetical protein
MGEFLECRVINPTRVRAAKYVLGVGGSDLENSKRCVVWKYSLFLRTLKAREREREIASERASEYLREPETDRESKRESARESER